MGTYNRYTYIGPGNANGNLARGVYYTPARLAYSITVTANGHTHTHAVTELDSVTLSNPPFVGNPYPYVIRSADSNAGADAPDPTRNG